MLLVIKFIKKYFKPFFFSLSIAFSFYLASLEMHFYNNTPRFFYISAVILLIYSIEIVTLYFLRTRKIQLNFNFNDNINELAELVNKIMLPLLLYISFVLFSQYHITSYFLNVAVVIIFVIFFIIFVNVQSFFRYAISAESKTHYVYDFTKMFIFFLLSDYLVNLSFVNNAIVLQNSIILFVISTVLKILIMHRSELFNLLNLLLSVFLSIILSVVFVFLVNLNKFNSLENSLFLLLFFYVSVAFLHHLNSKTLSIKILFEYILLLIMYVVIILGIN